MVVFNSDLDNTLIYSYKRDIGENKINVELYQGREISYMTEKSYKMLAEVRKKVCFVPTTTRTMEQYKRIDFGGEVPEYALVCNGGVLLVNGILNEEWYQESIKLIKECRKDLEKAIKVLENDINRCFEIRFINELFVFSKSNIPDKTVVILKSMLNIEKVDVFHNGTKVYVVPKPLNKGIGLERLKIKLSADIILAAGDSEFDIPMLEKADIAFAPEDLNYKSSVKNQNVIVYSNDKLISDEVLQYILNRDM
ncbi:MAG: HAD hydrolase family protein [Lachnotalea sp.]